MSQSEQIINPHHAAHAPGATHHTDAVHTPGTIAQTTRTTRAQHTYTHVTIHCHNNTRRIRMCVTTAQPVSAPNNSTPKRDRTEGGASVCARACVCAYVEYRNAFGRHGTTAILVSLAGARGGGCAGAPVHKRNPVWFWQTRALTSIPGSTTSPAPRVSDRAPSSAHTDSSVLICWFGCRVHARGVL